MLPSVAAELAESQLGVVARWQLLRHMTRGAVDQLVRRGWLTPVERGVLRLTGSPRLPDQRPIAAALRCRPNATITGPYVLSRHRIDGFGPDAPFEILTMPERAITVELSFAHREDPKPDRLVEYLGAVRLATALDALIDSGRFIEQLGERALRLAYDTLRWRGLMTPDDMETELDSRGDADPGAAALRDAFGADDLRSESEGERRLGRVLTKFLPAAEPQVWVTQSRRVDWYFRALRLALEYNGSVDHRGRKARLADARREREVAAAGIRVESFTAADVADETALTARVAALLTLRARELGVPAPIFVG